MIFNKKKSYRIRTATSTAEPTVIIHDSRLEHAGTQIENASMSNFDFYDEFTEFKRHILDELALVRQLLKPGETNLSTENLQLQLQLNNKTEVIDVLKNEIKHFKI